MMYFGHGAGMGAIWALRLLAGRFARGEIDRDEYQDRLATLRSARR